ncbi:MAG TPA: hypothetical protein VK550_11905 [Polyangiaceae bacterium]|nr:hypothetical protein [Polyangiaceae bacterium]
MIHPKRLLDGDGTEIERILLASGRAARPNARAKWRTGIVFFLMGLGTVSKAHAVALLGAKARAWTVAQWLAIGVGTGAAGWVAVHAQAEVPDPTVVVDPIHRRAQSAPSLREHHRVVPQAEAAPSPVNDVETSALIEPRTPAPALPTASRLKRSAALTASPKAIDAAGERSIANEIAELDRAREALGMAEPKRAIDRLNRYDRLFPQGTLREESLRLRIEALASTGERATARSLAQRFQALYPDSTHAERLKALVKEP